MPRSSAALRNRARALGETQAATDEEAVGLIVKAMEVMEANTGTEAPVEAYLTLLRGIWRDDGTEKGVDTFRLPDSQAEFIRAVIWLAGNYTERWARFAGKIFDLLEVELTVEAAKAVIASTALPEEFVAEALGFYQPENEEVQALIEDAVESGELRPIVQAFLEGTLKAWSEDEDDEDAESSPDEGDEVGKASVAENPPED